jgi:hypothetical protein
VLEEVLIIGRPLAPRMKSQAPLLRLRAHHLVITG